MRIFNSFNSINIVKKSIDAIGSNSFVNAARGNSLVNFTRNRKISPKDICNYLISKKGLSSKMEIDYFNEAINCDISSPGMLKQREKFDPNAILFLRDNLIKDLYVENKEFMETWKGYLLCAIDGSEIEVPNTINCRKEFRTSANQNSRSGVVRGKISNLYDILNNFVIDTQVGEYRESERKLALQNQSIYNVLLPDIKSIFIMDRGYRSIQMMYRFNFHNKYIMRLYDNEFSEEFEQYDEKSEDIIVDFINSSCPTTKGKVYRAQRDYTDFREFISTDIEFETRVVKIQLEGGNTEILATNLSMDEATIDELKELYNQRWGIESNFHFLKESIKIEQFSSSKKRLILQDIYVSMYVQNLVQIFMKESNARINQNQYKHKMKTNSNMAIGLFKKKILFILMIEKNQLRKQLMDELLSKMKEHIIPIRKGRKKQGTDKRRRRSSNKYSINKKKTF